MLELVSYDQLRVPGSSRKTVEDANKLKLRIINKNRVAKLFK